ncbi:fimbrial assembly protein [Piscinibacter aquaticus]|uniref:Type II secretion system protein H n=1 Tax=Piscinibacter aquaticus TaxID=392597 RepID=A0A5C6U1E1_9BURK|nr:fimbrial assembly protein [Piscinibacter aquaticus]
METRAAQHGLTLVEAAVVVGIVAAAATAATPGLQRLVEQRRLDGTATQLAADLQLARNEAIARNRVVRVNRDDAAGCYLLHTGPAGSCHCAADGVALCESGSAVIRSVSTPQRITLQSNAASIAFDPLHGTATPTATGA